MTDVNPGEAASRSARREVMTTRSPYRAFAATLPGYCLVLLDSTILATANLDIAADFRVDLSGALWATTTYLLGFSAFLVAGGGLGDSLGHKRMHLVGMLVFTAASVLCAVAPHILVLVVFRFAQGIGAALMNAQNLPIIANLFHGAERAKVMGIWSSLAGIALLVGPLTGGLLVDVAGWRSIFLLNLPIGVLGLVAAARTIPESGGGSGRGIDWLGVALSALAVASLVYGIHGREPLFAVIAVLLGGVFVAVQRRKGAAAVLVLSLFRVPDYRSAFLGVGCAGAAWASMFIPVLTWLQDLGASPTGASVILVPMAITAVGAASLLGRRVSGNNAFRLNLLGFGVAALALLAGVGTAVVLSGAAAVPVVAVLLGAVGCVNVLVWAPLSIASLRSTPEDLVGSASGGYAMARQVGAVTGTAVLASFYAGFGARPVLGLLVPGGFLLVGAVLAGVRGVTSGRPLVRRNRDM